MKSIFSGKKRRRAESINRAVITTRVIDHGGGYMSIRVQNNGNVTARNVVVHFPQHLPGIMISGNSSPVDIPAEDSFQIYIDISIDSPDLLELRLEWEDDFKSDNKLHQVVSL